MKTASGSLLSLAAVCLLVQPAQSQGGFREVLEIVGIEPSAIRAINAEQPTGEDWQTISRIVARLDQHSSDLDRWTQRDRKFSAQNIGELFDLEGTVEHVDLLTAPDDTDFKELHRCRVKLGDGSEAIALAVQVPKQWAVGKPLDEPVSLRGVLLRPEDPLVFLSSHVRWHPRQGLSTGRLLLARFGMDAALWDDVVQKTAFASPEVGRESQAFYSALAAMAKVPSAELAALAREAVAMNAETISKPRTQRDKAIEAEVREKAAVGLSSVAPLFLNPEEQAGQLVRIEGTARRAVRIVADSPSEGQPIREYYELEVFTDDSQNLPIVCLVARLPEGFPTGDVIRAGVRVNGVFFKLWRYHSRQTKETQGETTAPRASYTPVVMAGTVTWLKQATTPERWWGLAVGAIIFVLVIGGLLRILFGPQRRTLSLEDETPDFSHLQD